MILLTLYLTKVLKQKITTGYSFEVSIIPILNGGLFYVNY